MEGFEIIPKVKNNHTFYFIESHMKCLNNDIEINLESNHKYLRPLRKILEKEVKNNKNMLFTISIYALDFFPSLIKSKEIKQMNGFDSISIRISLKMNKNKFESKNYININKDSFEPFIKFEDMKKVFGKNVIPPEQIELSNLQIMQFFNEALIYKERIDIHAPCYVQLMRFGINLIKNMNSYEFILFLMLYIDILKGNDLQLIKEIFDIFKIEKIIKPLKSNDLNKYYEKFELLYNEQVQISEKIKRIPLANFFSYLIKFYTIHIYLYSITESYENCERLLIDLRDNNPFDKLIVAKIYISEYSQFYRNISISPELQNTLKAKLIYASNNYNELVKAFTLISDYSKKDFVSLLSIISDNYDKINEICVKTKSALKINDFINLNQKDDLTKIQNYLEIITQKKLQNKFKAIDFRLETWDMYIPNQNKFWEFLKVNLIKGALNHNELIKSLSYIIKFTQKNFIEILELITNNYDKFKEICMAEKKQININEFIQQNANDDIEKIKNFLSFIISEKLKDNYETINFVPNIWIYYINNKFQNEFLNFLEDKLYEGIIQSKDIFDCLDFSSNLKKKNFFSILEIISKNLDKIQKILKNEKAIIDIEKYINQNPKSDDLSKIYELIKSIIEKEKANSYASIKFNISLWQSYSLCDNLDTLKFIRKIIIECKIMEPELNEDILNLSQKIHDIGFNEIKKGILFGDKLLAFLGEDEILYVNKEISECNKKNKELENQVKELKDENNQLKGGIETMRNEIANLYNENTNLKNQFYLAQNRIGFLENNLASSQTNFAYLEEKMSNLERKVQIISSQQNK